MPVLVYALFGSSKELAVGPVAVTSLLISSSLRELVPHAADITNPNNPPPDLVRLQPAGISKTVVSKVPCVLGGVLASLSKCACAFLQHPLHRSSSVAASK
eukprot:GHRQ01038050.1.p1 GENE.GHRQ01038050.1~~GHRQ01038050.1.p1  ORF type:complete len:101 (-),score=20.30 GHRQ01038050.1:181-483(-)